MSKKQHNKDIQCYEAKPKYPMCSNCEHFKSDKFINEYQYEEEKNMRCEFPSLGGFAVKKQGRCSYHNFKTIENE